MALKTTTLPTGGGPQGEHPVLVRRGEAVGYCVYAMHRRKDLYGPDANLFKPERWEEDDGKLGRTIGYGYLPFNGGPRVCLGQELALLEAAYVVVRLVQKFSEFRVPPGDSEVDGVAVGGERQTLTLVLASAEGCWVEMNETCIKME
jgi:cytochrome P450